MTTTIRGLFITDVHAPDHINIDGVYKYARDFKPNIIILGGDIIDALGMYGADQVSPTESVITKWNLLYKRDILLIKTLLQSLPKCKIVYLEGNHEYRYTRLSKRYPELIGDRYNFKRDALPKNARWIPYGTYDSIYHLADVIFLHGNAYPDSHAKYYSSTYPGFKVVYGHLHHYQAYSNRRALINSRLNYAVTPGCLTHLEPEYKQGKAHQWQNGFISFIGTENSIILNTHTIEHGRFYVGTKEYK